MIGVSAVLSKLARNRLSPTTRAGNLSCWNRPVYNSCPFPDKIGMQKGKGKTFSFRRRCMRYVTAFCLFALLSGHRSDAQALPTSSAQNAGQPISVLIQPEAEYLGSVKGSIINHSAHKIWFTSCPDPYTVHLTDSSGDLVPYKHFRPPQQDQVQVCGGNIVYTIAPGETWNAKVAINEEFDLKAGTYSLTLLWHFPWNVRKTDQGEAWDTLTVSSNTISLTVTH
jgi:hypothetical protein